MISIIVSSRSINQFETLSKNIQKTIGVPYEIIRIENSNGVLSISAAYNKGAAQAEFPFLSFVHEDIQMLTSNWGIKIIQHFKENPDVGLIGTSGGTFKKRMLSNWGEFENDSINIRRVNIIQHFKFSDKQPENIYQNPLNEEKSFVVNMDGVFLCTTKEVWSANKFDENLLKGFHAYDLDFSMQIVQSKKLLVVYDVLLEHFSEGVCDLNWYDATLAVHLKWKKKLPVAIDLSISDGIDIYNCDWNKLRYIIKLYIRWGVGYFSLFKMYVSLFSLISYEGKNHALIKDFFTGWVNSTVQFFRYKTAGR